MHKSNPHPGAQERFFREALEKRKLAEERERITMLYNRDGFVVDRTRSMRNEPFIEVKAVEAKVDADFYDRGDDLT